MSWIKVCIRCDNRIAETLGDWLMEAGAESVTYQDQEDEPIYEPDPLAPPLWQNTVTTALFDPSTDTQELLARIKQRFELQDYWLERLENKNWQEQWLQYFHPMRFGKNLWICPEHSPPPESASGGEAKVVRLNPGLAFGTGTHPTTRLCLEWIADHLPAHSRVIDYGCGSGILAIAAVKMGAEQVWAVDLDPQALLATRQNAQANAVDARITATEPDKIQGHADVVLANILLKPLLMLKDHLLSLLSVGGTLVLSGILEEQSPQILSCYQPDIVFNAPLVDEGWCCLVGKRVSSHRKKS